ncbi:MAG: hypothetical protein J7K33_01270 [Candidatus Marinimicrobia bacterium]|nr:hypothetical protein [Candidatus Neomarinimicrobiota bacterium]
MKKGVQEVLNEVLQLIKEGYYLPPKLTRGKLYLYNALKQNKIFDLSSFSREEQKKIHEKAKQYAKQTRKKTGQEQERKQKEDEKSERTRSSPSYQQAGTGRKITLETLDRSHAKIVQNVTGRVSWFADVLNEIGFYATLIAMQAAKIPLEELYEKIAEFEDPEAFVEFVREHLSALFEAKEEAKIIIELRKKIDALELKAATLEEYINQLKEVIKQLKHQRDQAIMALYASSSIMDKEQLRDFTNALVRINLALYSNYVQRG